MGEPEPPRRPACLFNVIGLDDESEMLLAGASSMGLADAGANTAFSLALATVELLATRAGMEELVAMQVVMTMNREAGGASIHAHGVLERRTAGERRRKRRRRPKKADRAEASG